jgi:hypothetical protein
MGIGELRDLDKPTTFLSSSRFSAKVASLLQKLYKIGADQSEEIAA